MAAKPLPSQDYLRECFSYDRETGLVRWRKRPSEHFKTLRAERAWNALHPGEIVGHVPADARTDDQHPCVNLGKKLYRLHRIIWRMETGEDVSQIDHKDTDRTNNRWTNLRAATHTQNAQNQSGWRKHELPKGVRKNAGGDGYSARIMANRELHYLGTFPTADEAHTAYCAAAREHHGPFANFGRRHQK